VTLEFIPVVIEGGDVVAVFQEYHGGPLVTKIFGKRLWGAFQNEGQPSRQVQSRCPYVILNALKNLMPARRETLRCDFGVSSVERPE